MKKLLVRLFIGMAALGLVVGISELSSFLTADFNISKITSDVPYNEEWEVPIHSIDQKQAELAFSQTYSYLACGSQSYAFISDDGQFAIKFFKHKRWRLNPLIKKVPLPNFLHRKRELWLKKKRETIESTFNSCIVSYQSFREETGMVYLHLNRSSHLKKKLVLKDRLGMKHRLNLDDFEFTLQRIAVPTPVYLLSLKEKNDIKGAKLAIDKILSFATYRAKKGYCDKDPHPIKNFGFIDGNVIEIDVGGFYQDPKKGLDYFYKSELKKIENKFIPWLQSNYPELTSYIQEQIQTLQTSHSY